MEELYAKLLEVANDLRRITNLADPEFPADVVENVNDAIAYLDCARHNAAQHMGAVDGACRVAQSVVLRSSPRN
jgi:hypothetical protein